MKKLNKFLSGVLVALVVVLIIISLPFVWIYQQENRADTVSKERLKLHSVDISTSNKYTGQYPSAGFK